MLTIMVLGTPQTLRIGLIAGVVGLAIGLMLGLMSGFFGGAVDARHSRAGRLADDGARAWRSWSSSPPASAT